MKTKRRKDLGKFAVGYARVSTQRQGEEGISLEAQRRAIQTFSHHMGYELIEVYEDAASGVGEKSLNKRPGLTCALDYMQKHGAVLIVANWDRLSRYSAIEQQLENRGVSLDRVICATKSEEFRRASETAAFERASFERDLISRRTKEGMAAKKRAGATFGNPDIKDMQSSGVKAYSAKADRVVKEIAELIRRNILGDEDSYKLVADKLNAAGLLTAQDKS